MKYCKNYCGVECINGQCPLALAEQYPWEEYPDFKSCNDCPYNQGCKSCIDLDCKYQIEPIEE